MSISIDELKPYLIAVSENSARPIYHKIKQIDETPLENDDLIDEHSLEDSVLIERCRMIQHRCPWCGEKIPVHINIEPLIWRGPDLCPKCKKPYTSCPSWSSAIILAAGLVVSYFFKFFMKKFENNNVILYWVLVIAGIILFAIAFAELFRIPYARDIKKKEMLSVVPKRSANVNLSWENRKNEGLLLPRLQVLNGEIFPACFMDADGTPISTAFCVVLTDFFWLDKYHCTCKINFVLDDAPEENLFQKGNQFYLYQYYRKIANGTI